MKFLGVPFSIVVGAWLGMSVLPVGAAVIDLSKPVGETLTPTGLYWKFDEGAPGAATPVATDHSGNGYDGALTVSATNVTPTYASGKFGNGVHIQRTSGSTPGNLDPSVYWSNSASGGEAAGLDFSGTGAFTAGLWLKLDDYDRGANQTIYLIERGSSVFVNTAQGATQRNFFSFQLNKWTADNWTLSLLVGDGVNPSVSIGMGNGISFTNPNDLDWHHFAFSLESGDGGSVVRFYVDGQLLGTQAVDFTLAALDPTKGSERQVRVGERSASQYLSAFNGVIDDVFITEGAHAFAIPEPSGAMLLPLAGAGLLFARGVMRRKRGSL